MILKSVKRSVLGAAVAAGVCIAGGAALSAGGCEQHEEPAAHQPEQPTGAEPIGGSNSTAGRARDAAQGAIDGIQRRQDELGDKADSLHD